MTAPGEDQRWPVTTVDPGPADDVATLATELTELLRRHEERGRGWASASYDDVAVQLVPPGSRTRQHALVRDRDVLPRGWASVHDRAAGRVLVAVTVDPRLADAAADEVADALFGWAEQAVVRVGADRGLELQQADSGSFADDRRQQAWLSRAGFAKARTWWQMSRPVRVGEADEPVPTRPGVRIRLVGRRADGLPDEDDLRTVHDVLERAFADHFNSHRETFDEFVSRLREDPGHRWDHWWIAELVDGDEPQPAGALVGSVTAGEPGSPGSPGTRAGSYVDYLGVLESARGRGVAKALLATVVADAAARGRDRVGLEVDADSPTGADGLYLSLGWTTSFVTESWHRDVVVDR